jgi:hypothetical protein
MVFTRTGGPVDLRHLNLWWTGAASWRRPVGPHSSIDKRADHPVVHVTLKTRRRTRRGRGCIADRGGGEAVPGPRRRDARGRGTRAAGQRLASYCTAISPGAPTAYGRTTAVGTSRPNMARQSTWRATCGMDHRLVRRHPRRDPCCEAGSYDPGSRSSACRARCKGRFVPVRRQLLPALPSAARRPQPVDTGMSHIGFRCIKR